MRLRTTALFTAAVLGCGASVAPLAAEPNPAATLIYYDAVGNETLDPAEPQSGSSFSQEVLLALYDTLVRLDDKGNPGPGLAESWQTNADLTVYTFKLRQGVKFHDGTDLTADVVKRNIDRNMALGPRSSGAMIDSIKPLASVEVLGPYELKLNLKSPSGQIPFVMGGVAGMVASAASVNGEDFGATFKPIGSGAYRLQVVRVERENRDGAQRRLLGRHQGTAGEFSTSLRTRRPSAAERSPVRPGNDSADRSAPNPRGQECGPDDADQREERRLGYLHQSWSRAD